MNAARVVGSVCNCPKCTGRMSELSIDPNLISCKRQGVEMWALELINCYLILTEVEAGADISNLDLIYFFVREAIMLARAEKRKEEKERAEQKEMLKQFGMA